MGGGGVKKNVRFVIDVHGFPSDVSGGTKHQKERSFRAKKYWWGIYAEKYICTKARALNIGCHVHYMQRSLGVSYRFISRPASAFQ